MRNAGHAPRVRRVCSNVRPGWEGQNPVHFINLSPKHGKSAFMTGVGSDGDPRPGDGSGEALAAAARAILEDARSALSDEKLTEAETVHDVRKAFKRWRALLRLLSGPLGRPANEMRAQARDLMRAL